MNARESALAFHVCVCVCVCVCGCMRNSGMLKSALFMRFAVASGVCVCVRERRERESIEHICIS
jgi:hypothetical protein